MKQRFNTSAILFFFLFLISSHQISARFLVSTQEQERAKKGEISDGVSLEDVEDSDINKLRGMENCEKADEECIERRILIDAHLDYIYTQHHRP